MNKNTNEKSFGFEWKSNLNLLIEKQTLFGKSREADLDYFFSAINLNPKDTKGSLLLDAGCGSGRLTFELTKYNPKIVYGIDIHSAINLVQKKYKNIHNLKILRADIFHLPFKKNTFDLVWCNGVIHHTCDPYLAFQKLAEVVKPGGKMYIWVYEKRFSPYKFTKDIFRFTHLDRVPYPILFRICQFFSVLSIAIHNSYKIVSIPLFPYLRKSKYFLNTRRNRTYEEFLMTWFDALSPQYDFRFTKEEVTKWFLDNGFKDLKYYWDQVGICGIKN